MADNDLPEGEGIPASNGEGWDWFAQQADKTMKEAAARLEMERNEIAIAFLRMSKDPDGAIVLKTLRAWADVLGFDPALGYDKGAAMGFFVEGQRNVIRFIDQTIRQGEKI